jgi:hypothetical protein
LRTQYTPEVVRSLVAHHRAIALKFVNEKPSSHGI